MMDECYWRFFVNMKVGAEYFRLCALHYQRLVRLMNAICVLGSCAGLYTWLTNTLSPTHSSLIILAFQLICALQPIYPFNERQFSGQLLYDAYNTAATKTERTMNQFLYGDLDISALFPSRCELQDSVDLAEKSVGPSNAPPIMRLHKKAEAHVTQYIQTNFSQEE